MTPEVQVFEEMMKVVKNRDEQIAELRQGIKEARRVIEDYYRTTNLAYDWLYKWGDYE